MCRPEQEADHQCHRFTEFVQRADRAPIQKVWQMKCVGGTLWRAGCYSPSVVVILMPSVPGPECAVGLGDRQMRENMEWEEDLAT